LAGQFSVTAGALEWFMESGITLVQVIVVGVVRTINLT
jgi:hypothetical protein